MVEPRGDWRLSIDPYGVIQTTISNPLILKRRHLLRAGHLVSQYHLDSTHGHLGHRHCLAGAQDSARGLPVLDGGGEFPLGYHHLPCWVSVIGRRSEWWSDACHAKRTRYIHNRAPQYPLRLIN
jgi:hypothetical protein